MKNRTYIAIDLKSFYASVECRERGLDPLDTNLVVADESRTDKTMVCVWGWPGTGLPYLLPPFIPRLSRSAVAGAIGSEIALASKKYFRLLDSRKICS